jgi:signal transduction histidine kinase
MVNACEAMRKGGVIVVSEDVADDSELNRVVRIRIGDNGPGIPAAFLGKVLQPFFTTKEEGTGLGLSIAHRIIAEHGGRLDVASVEGRGAAFTITLPLTGDQP